jgi:hypothetical protein
MAFGTRRLRKPSGALSVIPSASPEDALEPALRAGLVARSAAAGGICLYEPSEGVLRLVLEVGLSDEGCRRLRRISLGDPAAWVAPLQSLLARRLRILERSSGDDVPPLLEPADAISAIACIPLYAEERPRGSLILVGVGAMELNAVNLREADPAVIDITRIVESIGRRGLAAAHAEPPPTDALAALVAPATRQRLESLGRLGQTPTLDRATLAGADFPAVLTGADECDDREAVDRAHSAELEHLVARLTEAERAWAREHSLRVEQELRYERARRRAETERSETARRARDLVANAESLRSAAVAEAESARGTLADAQRRALEARHATQRMQAEADAACAAEKAANAERDQLVRALDEARGSAAEAARRHQLEGDSVALAAREAEVDARWRAKLAEAERMLEQERQTRAELADARAREAQTRELLRVVTEDREGTIARVTELARAAEEARASAMSEVEAIRTALGNAQALIIQAEDEAQQARAESERQEVELRAIRSEREQLIQALEKARAGLGESEPRSLAPAHSPACSSSATVPGTAGEERLDETPAPGPGVVAIVGGDDAFAAAPPTGIQVAVLRPEPHLARRLTQLGARRVVVNLASAGCLAAVASLRAEGYGPPLWGCLAVPESAAVLPLGPIETVPRSLDPETVLALLGRRPGGGTRLLAIGTTPDSLLGLRPTLTRAGVSMSIAWDAKQAADLLGMVRPEVVIVDLALPSGGGYKIVANLAYLEPQPLTVLLPAEGDDAAAAFAAALTERSHRGGAVPRAKALQTILTQRGAAAQRT